MSDEEARRRGWAEWYIGRGWTPVWFRHGLKGPKGADGVGWSSLRLDGAGGLTIDVTDAKTKEVTVTPVSLDVFDGLGNIGVLTGAVSDGLADVDLDDPRGDVQALAPAFLPDTMTFGRASKRRSHWLYRCKPAGHKGWSILRLDTDGAPVLDADGKRITETLLELRSNGNQTMAPPSIHPESGERVEWSEGLDLVAAVPLDVDRLDLEERCKRLAVAALLVREGMGRGEAADVAREASGDALRERLRFELHRAAVGKWFAPVEAPRALRPPSRAPDLTGSNERAADWLARIGESKRPGDLFNRNGSWADILTPHGWTEAKPINGHPSWRRPGSKKPYGECSAYVSSDGGRLFVKSTNGGALDAGDYDKIGAFARLEGLTIGDAARLIPERFNMPAPLDGRDDRATQEIAAANMAHVLEGARRGDAGELEDGGAFLEDGSRAAGAPPPGAPGVPVEASTKSAAAPVPAAPVPAAPVPAAPVPAAPVPAAPAVPAAPVPAALTNGPGELPELAPHLRPPRRAMLLTRPYALGERPEFEGAGEPGFLPRGIVAMLVGEGGGGKTQAAVQLAVAVATAGLAVSRESDAGRWLGTYKATERGRVALALGEEDDEEIHRRVWFALRALEEREEAAHDAFGFDKKRGPRAVWKYADAVRENVRPWALAGVSSVFIVPVDATPRFSGPRACDPTEEFKAFEAALWRDGKPWSLVVLDPATRFLGADSETNNKAATEWMTLVHRLTKLPGNPAVLVIHHTNKAARKEGIADASASRGSSALTDGARWVATLAAPHRDDDSTVCDLRLTLVKANYVRAGLPPLELVRDDEHPNYLRPMTLREKDTRTAERDREAIELEATKKGREKAIGDLAKTKSETIKAGLTAPPAGNAGRGGAAAMAPTLRGGQHTGGGDDDDIRPR